MTAWPSDSVEKRPVAALVPYARNARTHSDAQIAQIAGSIKEWGWTVPVLADEAGVIIAGHGRVLAAQRLGLVDVPVMVARNWTEAQKRAYTLADNKLTENGGWDTELLRLEVADLAGMGFHLPLMGFSEDELMRLSGGNQGLTDPDEVPEVPAVPVAQRGDLWRLGRHWLVCGDSTNQEDVASLMRGESADLCFTSPPYVQQRDYGAIIQDWDGLMQGVFQNVSMTPAGQILVNLGLVHRDGEWLPYWDGWIEWMRGQGWRRFGWYVWDQGPGLPGDWNGRLAPSHEFIFHFNKASVRARKTKAKLAASIEYNDHGNGMRRKDGTMSGVSSPEKSLQTHKIPDTVFRVMRHKARGIEMAHPAVFPVNLAVEIITSFSDAGTICYEPMAGSGSQIIAAEMTGRICHALEINPAYCDVTVERWQNFTGEKAKRMPSHADAA